MARRSDPPGLQAAKGFPGKRKKQERARAKLAQQLREAPRESADPFAAPAVLERKELLPALALWRHYAPEMVKRNMSDTLYRDTFAMFCIEAADYYAAVVDLAENGWTQEVKTVSGDMMIRDRPAVRQRDACYRRAKALADEFGLHLSAKVKIDRDRGNAMPFLPGLGDDAPTAPTPHADEHDDILGAARRH
jgi:phage terminase small subunit